MKKYKKLLLALAAVMAIYAVKLTGLDRGLIDDVLQSAVDAVTSDEVVQPALVPVVAPDTTLEGK